MEELIKKLKQKLSKVESERLLNYIAKDYTTFVGEDTDLAESSDLISKTGLDSPDKQLPYLVGLLMSTDYIADNFTDSHTALKHYEKIEENNIEKRIEQYKNEEKEIQNYVEEIKELYSMIPKITYKYMNSFFDVPTDTIDNEWIKKREVCLPVFLAYFNMGGMRYAEQLEERIKEWFSPFDDIIKERFGFNINNLLDLYQYTIDNLKIKYKKMKDCMNYVENLRLEALKVADESNNYDKFMEKIQEQRDNDETKKISETFNNLINNYYCINKSELVCKFGNNIAESLLKQFALDRKEREYKYYTEENPFSLRPLCMLDDDRYFIIHPKFVLEAIFLSLKREMEVLHKNKIVDFYKVRGDKTEEKVCDLLTDFFGRDNIKVYQSVCEQRGTNEHDLMIIYKDKILIIEIKSSNIREPMRNPDKGFIKIKDSFKSKEGIGGAYNQAVRLEKYIKSKEEVTLYNKMYTPFKLKYSEYSKVYKVIITAENFGLLGVNNSLLLDKDETGYAWCCNIYDLETLLDSFKYLGKTAEDFIKYIEDRILLHERIFSFDELDIAEVYLNKGKLKDTKANKLWFMNNHENLFDKIYFEKQGIPYKYNINTTMKNKSKVGRNDPCPCGSGKKFKKCCGKN